MAADYLTLKQAAARLPSRPHVSTLHRWRLRGVRGRKLRTTLIGGRRYTTSDWLEEFVSPEAEAPMAPPMTNRRQTSAISAAESELALDGV